MRLTRWMLVCGLLMWSGSAPALAAEPGGAPAPFEGTRWAVTVMAAASPHEVEGEPLLNDLLIFKDGKVEMSVCRKHGFQASTYSLLASGEPWTFRTEQLSKRQGKTVWIGQVTEDAIHGTIIWMKKDGTTLHYTFAGTQVL